MARTWLSQAFIGGGFAMALLAMLVSWGGFSASAMGMSGGLEIYPWGFKEKLMGVGVAHGWLSDHVADEFGSASNVARVAFLGYLLGLGLAFLATIFAFRGESPDGDVAFVSLASGVVLLTSAVLIVLGAIKAFSTMEFEGDVTVAHVLEWSGGLFLGVVGALLISAGGVRILADQSQGREGGTGASPGAPKGANMRPIPHVSCPNCHNEVPVLQGSWPQCTACGHGGSA